MATKDICTVEQLDNSTDVTNIIIDESGKLRKVNLKKAVNNFTPPQEKIEQIQQNTNDIALIRGDVSDLNTQVSSLSEENTELKDKIGNLVSKKQGTENSGKALIVDENGNVICGEAGVSVDATLSEEGKAADAKATGDAISELKGDLNTLSLGVHTDGLIYVFVNGVPKGTGVKQGTSGDVVGYVDSENNIVLAGELAEGTYTLKYEMEDGSLIDIGELNLSVVNYTNLIPTSVTTDGVTIYNGVGYKNDVRLRTDGIEEATMSGQFATGFIPVVVGDIIRIKGATYNNNYTKIVGYDSSFTNITDEFYDNGWGATNWDIAESDGTLACTLKSNNIAWARFTAVGDGANVIITRNEEIS